MRVVAWHIKPFLLSAFAFAGLIGLWHTFDKPLPLEISDVHITVLGNWFPGLSQRVRTGAADTWREPETSIAPYDFGDVLDPIANKTFFMLKTGANVMWNRLPVHLATTLRRFPYHQIYSDESAVIGNESIIDIIGSMGDDIPTSNHLIAYRVRRQNVEDGWGWDNSDIKLDSSDEGWQSDKFKNIPMILHAFRVAPKHCDWFVFADDDTYMHSQSLGSLLRNLDPKKPYYLGSQAVIYGGLSDNSPVNDNPKTVEDLDDISLAFAHGGSGVIISRGALRKLFWDPQREDDTVAAYARRTVNECCGDAMVGFILRQEIGVRINDGVDPAEFYHDPFQGERITHTRIPLREGGLCQRLISWHHLDAPQVVKLYQWENSVKERKPHTDRGILYSDAYHDFVLPHIATRLDNWDNFASSERYNTSQPFKTEEDDDDEEGSSQIWPGRSADDCERACQKARLCLGWKYETRPGSSNICFLESQRVQRGVAYNDFVKVVSEDLNDDPDVDKRTHIVSGWRLDEIRRLRSGEVCDSLEYDMDNDKYNDNDDEAEGWYIRSLEKDRENTRYDL